MVVKARTCPASVARGGLAARIASRRVLVPGVEVGGIGEDPTGDTPQRRWFGSPNGGSELAEVFRHDLPDAAVAVVFDLVKELGGVGAVLVATLVQGGLGLFQQAGSSAGAVAGQQLVGALRASKAAHGAGASPSRAAIVRIPAPSASRACTAV